MFGFELESAALASLAAVILIDIVLSGDNAVVIGLAVAGLPHGRRRRIVAVGILVATLMRIGFAFIALPLLKIIGLTLAGGILLLWVAWKMWREIRGGAFFSEATVAVVDPDAPPAPIVGKTAFQALTQIVLADLSMSLDNVLAVAGAAREHPYVLALGLLLSVTLMAVASAYIADLLNRYRWLVYFGLVVITGVALDMIWSGGWQIWRATGGAVG